MENTKVLNAQNEPSSQPQEVSPPRNLLEPLQSALAVVRQAAIASGYNVEASTLNVYVGTSKLFSSELGKLPEVNALKPSQIDLVARAIFQPESVKGTVRISIGGAEVYKVSNGLVKTDRLNLAQYTVSSAIEKNPTTAQSTASTASPTVPPTQLQSPPSQQALTSSQKEVTSLETVPQLTIQELSATIASLQARLEQMEKNVNSTPKQPSSVASWLSRTEGAIATSTRGVLNQINSGLSALTASLSETGEHLIRRSQEATANTLLATLKAGLAVAGEKLPTGAVALESVKHGIRLEVSPDRSLALNQRPQRHPSEMWQQYSFGVHQPIPFHASVAVVQKAFQDGCTAQEVKNLLKADPQYQHFLLSKGEKAAENYATLVISDAVRREAHTHAKTQPTATTELKQSSIPQAVPPARAISR